MKRLLLLLLCLPALAGADERILDYHSELRVFPDGMLEVTETIKVRAEGKQIRRGIYRDFPVEYTDRLGNEYKIKFTPLALQRNGSREPFHSVRGKRDVRTYFGSRNRFLEHGEHTYVFRYRVNRMLGFFDEHDEIYWNVTGNRWAFPIDKASATVKLEFDVARDALMVEAYTGRYGSGAQDYGRYLDDDGGVHFEANNALPAGHGLTIVVGWPKGFVDEPTAMDRFVWLLKDNANLLAAVVGLALLLAYYIPVWNRYGKDPEEGVIVTRYKPPEGLSPASIRYIRQMYYDDKVMTAAIINLAVKGYIEIEERGGEHTLRKLGRANATAAMAPGEEELYNALFESGPVVELEAENLEALSDARKAHRKSLQQNYRKEYFRWNGHYNIPAIVIFIVSMVVSLNVGSGPTPAVIGVLVVSFIAVVVFAVIMRRPTLRGRQLLDEMLGFKDYLEVAEKEELNLRNPPEKTPALFEALLPYALALGVEQAWAEKFSTVLASVRGPDGHAYQPSWYNGSWDVNNLSAATSDFTSGLGDAVKTATTPPPGSSSGFSSGGSSGGGGFSGGGGGGGGGGGW